MRSVRRKYGDVAGEANDISAYTRDRGRDERWCVVEVQEARLTETATAIQPYGRRASNLALALALTMTMTCFFSATIETALKECGCSK